MALAVRFGSVAARSTSALVPRVHHGAGSAFLGIKAVEYDLEDREHLVPGLYFRLPRELGPGIQQGSLST